MSIFSAAALCLWYGITLVRQEKFSNGTVILVVVSIIISSIAIGKALPEIEALAAAVTAAKKVYAIINRVSCENSTPLKMPSQRTLTRTFFTI